MIKEFEPIISTTYYLIGSACGIFGVVLNGINLRRASVKAKKSEANEVYTKHLQRDFDQIEEALTSFRMKLWQMSNLSGEEFSNRFEKVIMLNEEYVFCNAIISDALDYCSKVCPVKKPSNESWRGLADFLDPVANALNIFEKKDLKIGDFQDHIYKCSLAICNFRVGLHSFMREHVK